jgi:dCMP deaminase
MDRPDWTQYYLNMAEDAGARGACTRRKVGALVEYDHHVYGTGYNGTPRGSSLSCLEGDCPRGRHFPHVVVHTYLYTDTPPVEQLVCSWDGKQWPCPDSAAPLSDYNRGPGKCIAIHAEMNALIDALRHGLPPGGNLYCNQPPCEDCIRFMMACQVKKCWYLDEEKLAVPIDL